MMFILTVDYLKDVPESYAGIVLKRRGEEVYRSDSGDINIDIKNATAIAEEWDGYIYQSSSVADFFAQNS